jgi:hypothetical protein
VAEHIVERAILEEHQDDVIHGVGVGVLRHDFPLTELSTVALSPPSLSFPKDIAAISERRDHEGIPS